jgi:hypothetical protein
MKFEDYFLDEMGDITVPWSVKGDCPLMRVSFVDVWTWVFDVG